MTLEIATTSYVDVVTDDGPKSDRECSKLECRSGGEN